MKPVVPDLGTHHSADAESNLAECRMRNRLTTTKVYRSILCKLKYIHPENSSWPAILPFRYPVNPRDLKVPEYHNVIREPMDFYTIEAKLRAGAYAEPWAIIRDFELVFENARKYSSENREIRRCTQTISKAFYFESNKAMKQMDYCCGQNWTYNPRILSCYGAEEGKDCVIKFEADYYTISGDYNYCLKCFNNIKGKYVTIIPCGDTESADNPIRRIPKANFLRVNNSELIPESFVECIYCERKFHQICVLYLEATHKDGFCCPKCQVSRNIRQPVNPYTAQNLPTSQLSQHIERRVNKYLKRQGSPHAPVFVRVLSSVNKLVDVLPKMKQRFLDSGQLKRKNDSFPYRSKGIFAFMKVDEVDTVFFGMYVQEYGSKCPAPNTRRVYISYLDSINIIQAGELRTRVYHEIVLGYLEHVKKRGFTVAHIWSCPPGKGKDYIFNAHPEDMKIPTPKRLQDWYRQMLDRGVRKGIFVSYQDIFDQFTQDGVKRPEQFPYFEGDYWPPILEKAVVEFEKQESAQRCSGDAKGAPKPPPAKKKKMTPARPDNGVLSTPSIVSDSTKIKNCYFLVRLHPADSEHALGDTCDPDPVHKSPLMDDRSSFLFNARDYLHEFSSLRRAKFSTMCYLYELHTEERETDFKCSKCRRAVVVRLHCRTCLDYDLCVYCYEDVGHCHEMKPVVPDLATHHSADAESVSARNQLAAYSASPRQGNRLTWWGDQVRTLIHVVNCQDSACPLPNCWSITEKVMHYEYEICDKGGIKTCPTCRHLYKLSYCHALNCNARLSHGNVCLVPECDEMRRVHRILRAARIAARRNS